MKYTSMFIIIMGISISCQTTKREQADTQDSVAVAAKVEPADVSPTEIAKVERIEKLPDFTQYTDVKEKKEAFFNFLTPMVEAENNRIIVEREKIKKIFAGYEKSNSISEADSLFIEEMASEMRINDFTIANPEHRNILLKRKDIIPPALFLAQAANESSWGTSRFARQANNLFGQWCFKPGCGVVPSQRPAGEINEVQRFETVNDAVNSYVRNLNSHNAYTELRDIRAEMRNEGKIPDGQSLAEGLIKYSERGEEYVDEIQAMIRVNKLETRE